ncbi:MAG TPA: CDP-glycerol glycerophosphotransferase family protein [Candidatus Brachybacterium merdavium]|uniref:CDP-glycerol glycerophosphotransferase family protein n=1 Tax=Candidatus Brachybacterium merdavium TaxID=2838513 RepID=A0A9D2LBC5_9MICO|nr:CDP-glycerol glycerophosphotransferase family protein [Candidatus Brachybacterium merdavium]
MMSLWPALVNTLAVLATVAVVSTGGTRWAPAAFLVPLVIILWRQRRTVLRVPRGVGGLGRYITARFILIAAAGAQIFAASQFQALEIAAFACAMTALAVEPMVRSANGVAAPYASNFPGPPARNRAAFPYGWIFTLNLVGLLALVLTDLAATPLLAVAGAVSIVSIVLALLAFVDIAQRIRARRRFQANLPQLLEEVGPVFYLYWHAPPRSAFQVTMWLPYLERLGVPFVLVVRTIPNFRQLASATDHPVLLRRSIPDLDALIVPSARGVFYVNNAMRNNHMVRYSGLTHIQLLHGESDKASSANPVTRMYDRDFVAGQAAIDRFEKFGVSMHPDIFRIVGRPQVEEVYGERGLIGQLENPSVLYAPTWLGYQAETNYSSLAAGPTIIQGLLDRSCRVVFRPHPYSSRDPELREACRKIRGMLEADAATTGREHLFGALAEKEMSVFDCFNVSDALISDVSAVVGDFLHSGKPLAMVSPRTGAEEFVEEFPMANAAYVLVAEGNTVHNLDQVLDELIGRDSKREERLSWATYYLGDIPRENYADRFVQVAREELGLEPV